MPLIAASWPYVFGRQKMQRFAVVHFWLELFLGRNTAIAALRITTVRQGCAPTILKEGDLAYYTFSQLIFLGINYYGRDRVAANSH